MLWKDESIPLCFPSFFSTSPAPEPAIEKAPRSCSGAFAHCNYFLALFSASAGLHAEHLHVGNARVE